MKAGYLKNQSGMTLVETMIASVVAMVVMMALVSMVASNQKGAADTRRSIEVTTKQNIAFRLLSNDKSCAARVQLPGNTTNLVENQRKPLNIIDPEIGLILTDGSRDGISLYSLKLNPVEHISTNVVEGTQRWKALVEIGSTLNNGGSPTQQVNELRRSFELFLTWNSTTKTIVSCSTAPEEGDGAGSINTKWVEFFNCPTGTCNYTFGKAFVTPPKIFIGPRGMSINSNGQANISYTVSTTSVSVTITGAGGAFSNVAVIAIGNALDGSKSGLMLDTGEITLSGSGSQTGKKWFNIPFKPKNPDDTPYKPVVMVFIGGMSWSDSCNTSCDGEGPTVQASASVSTADVNNESFLFTLTKGNPGDGSTSITKASYLALGYPHPDAHNIQYPVPSAVNVSAGAPIWDNMFVDAPFGANFSNPPKTISLITGLRRDVDCGNSDGVIETSLSPGASGGTVKLNGDNGCDRFQVMQASSFLAGN